MAMPRHAALVGADGTEVNIPIVVQMIRSHLHHFTVARRKGVWEIVQTADAPPATHSLTPREKEVLTWRRAASPPGRSVKFSMSPREPSTSTSRQPSENAVQPTGLRLSRSPSLSRLSKPIHE